ncbi:unnamed protein product [Somion occarium]|uniref:Uncharacterized protein n=1 Tax=Somion occarium TaxID=3059160 RepID=A0ABP1D425_9APHY
MSAVFTTEQYDAPRRPQRLALLLTPIPPPASLQTTTQSQPSRLLSSPVPATPTPPPRSQRLRSNTAASAPSRPRPRRRRTQTLSAGTATSMSSSHPNIPFASSSSFIPPTGHIRTAHFLDESGSPPPYSPTPPEPPECLQSSSTNSASPFLAKRAASTPHLHSPPLSPSFPAHPHSIESSRRPSTSTLHARRARHAYETSDDPDTDASMSEDTVIYTSTQPSLAGTLRARLFGKGKGRADFEERMRPISTTPGVLGAGETETEGEDSSPRHLPTARITSSSTSNSSTFLSTLTTDASAILPSPPRSLIPILFELSRLLSIVPAVFGTLYNIYHIVRPPDRGNWTRAEYFVSALWVRDFLFNRFIIIIIIAMSRWMRVIVLILESVVDPYWLAMSPTHDGSFETMESVLQSSPNLDPITRFTSYMLARHSPHLNLPRTRETSISLLGRHRHNDLLQSKYPDVGNVQHHRFPSSPSSFTSRVAITYCFIFPTTR